MSYDVYWVKNRAEKNADFEHPTLQGDGFAFIITQGDALGQELLPFQGVLGNFNRTVRRILGDTMTKKETSDATSCHTACYVFINTD